ncbi:MAG TPA: phage terminase large subunit [Pirellulales bacterium]|nr:phage terminase large subunit [Pirellulales bacterium]
MVSHHDERLSPLKSTGLLGRAFSLMLSGYRRALYEDQGRGAATTPLLTWACRYLPAHFSLPPSAMHRWLEAQLDQMPACRGSKLNVIGPRGGAKSTIGTLAWPLRLAVEGREPYIWIISDTKHQACAHLENIKSELLDNRRLASHYPWATGRGPVWRAGAITLRNGAAIEAFGTGQHIRGRRRKADRPTLIICDDLQNDEHIESALQREHSRRWFHGTLLKAGKTTTNFLNLATALHREALALELDHTPGWLSRTFRAIEHWPDNLDLWQQWEMLYADVEQPDSRDQARTFYDGHRDAMEHGALVLWPAHEDLYALMCMRLESGHTAFEREKQGSPIDPEACEWPEAYFGPQTWFDDWPRRLRVRVLALDPSKGGDARRGDYSAYVLLGVDMQGTLFVEAWLARRPTPEMVAEGVELCRRFRPDAFAIESNQFQDLLAPLFADEFRRQGLLDARPWAVENHVNKLVRIRRLGPYLASGRVRFKSQSPGTTRLVEQLRQFPAADHDDGPDAFEMAVRLAAEMLASAPGDDGLGNRLPLGH